MHTGYPQQMWIFLNYSRPGCKMFGQSGAQGGNGGNEELERHTESSI